jgi:thiol-disulfide isomerase/thioredoxin
MSGAVALLVLMAGAAREAPTPTPPSIKWEKGFEAALGKAKAAGKPVLVDFWAEWCAWCHRLDQSTYVDPWVVRKAQAFVAVKVDTEGSRKEQAIAERYEVRTLPTIVFLSPEGRQLLRVPFQGPGQFPHTLDTALRVAQRVMSWEQALARNPDDARALFALGNHLFEQEYIEEARELLKKAVERDAQEDAESRRRARMLLAIVEHVSRNFVAAERLAKEALALPPSPDDQPMLLFVLGRIYGSWGKKDDAVATLEVIVREYPASPVAAKARETLVNLRNR